MRISSFQSLIRVQLFASPWTAALQASLSITNSQSLPKLMSIELVMPSNHLILCCPLLLLPSIFPSIRVLSNESCLSSSYSQRKWGTDTTALSFIRDFIKVKFLRLKESVREHKAHEASSDLIVNHWLRFFVGIAASFQVQIIIRILLWPLRRKHRSARTTYIQPTPGYSLPWVKNHTQ